MRLRSLELENFRRHRRTRLDFQDGVTALVGPNGAGKSTLIEAVAFALFGPRAAGTGKDLVRSESAGPGDNVRVALELEVGGQAVRIVRELRGRPQSPLASLEVDGHVQVQPIAGSSDQATLLVERLLGLDRDGFFQTVVARQGELDRLSRLKPAERRTFVLDLVGIGAVDAAITRARESRNAVKLQADEAARHVGDPALLDARVASAQQADATAAAAAKVAHERKVEAEALAVQASARHEAARQAANERAALDHQVALLSERAAGLHRESARTRAEVAQAEAHAARVPELRAALASAEPFEAQLANAQGLVLVRQQRTVQVARIAQQTALLGKLTAEADAIVAPPLPDVPRLAHAAEACQAASVQAERERAVATERASQARQSAAALAALQGGKCPSCQQPVTPEHVAAERAAASDRLAAAEAEAARSAALARQAAHQVAAAREAVAAAQLEMRRSEAAHRRKAELAEQAANLRSALAALEETLPPDPGPVAELAELQRHAEQARAARLQLASCEAAAARLPPLRQAATQAERLQQATDAELGALNLRLATQPDAAAGLRKAKADSEQAWTLAAAARADHTAALLAGQAAQAALELALAEQARDGSARARLAALQKDLAAWTAVVGAAGGGLLERFREHLVSRAAPAINQEASHLLSLFTQGRYTELVLDESYEVWMGDGGVLHPIERFSGGEQDLAHLALRLGISRLLATRANAPEIRFLALDEVFSSLDQERCTTLLGALHNLGGLYSQVLAVTHLERLQESFDGVAHVGLVDGEAHVTVHTG
jgi:DNA repair protein SbcC/Rad50